MESMDNREIHCLDTSTMFGKYLMKSDIHNLNFLFVTT